MVTASGKPTKPSFEVEAATSLIETLLDSDDAVSGLARQLVIDSMQELRRQLKTGTSTTRAKIAVMFGQLVSQALTRANDTTNFESFKQEVMQLLDARSQEMFGEPIATDGSENDIIDGEVVADTDDEPREGLDQVATVIQFPARDVFDPFSFDDDDDPGAYD